MSKKLDIILKEIEDTEAKLSLLRKIALELSSSKKASEKLEKEHGQHNTPDLDEINRYKLILEEKEKIIKRTEEFSKIGRWTYYFDRKILEWSAETYKIFEYPLDYKGSLQEFYLSCLDSKTLARIMNQGQLLRVTRENEVMNQTIITPLGNKKLLSFSSSPIINETDEIIGVKGMVKDVSDKITGSNGLDNFFDLSFDLHCIIHMDTYFVKLSPAWSKLLGYSEKELLARSYMEFIHPEDTDSTVLIIKELCEKGSFSQFENRYITKSGEIVFLSWNVQLDNETQLMYCNAIDITKSKQDKEALLNDLNEKELLLREIHHRVKNNLQIISSLLSLQAGANSTEKHLKLLYEDSQNRIKSMAAIHEMFYQSEELDKIEFGQYLNKLVGDLATSLQSENKTIDFKINADTVYLNLDTAIPLGLLINEIITNSIKHGEDKSGNVHISVAMNILEKGLFQLTIGDTGVNCRADILKHNGESLGVLLINSLVEQIDGDIEQVKGCEGTVFNLTFQNNLGIQR